MTISDSIPIQFWDIDEDTFNETDVCGLIKQDCFCQPFQCDDTIHLQVQNNYPVTLDIYDSADELLTSIDMNETSVDVWDTSFIITSLLSPEICDTRVQFKLRLGPIFTNTTFDYLTPWFNNNPAARPDSCKWSAIGGFATSTSTNVIGGSQQCMYQFDFKSGLTYTITFDYAASGGGTMSAFVWVLASDTVPTTTQIVYSAIPASTTSFSFIPSQDFSYIYFAFAVTSGTVTVTVDNIITPTTNIKKSDCLDIRSTQDCTILLVYENTSDFDGIDYENGSPGPSFQVRIPAIFFEEDNPQEQEDLELSNGVIVTLRQSIVEKRKLETGFMPNYMHRKLQKVLMHDSVYIDGDYWKKRDSYDPNPVKKYNLKTASVLLTKYDSVEKNTI